MEEQRYLKNWAGEKRAGAVLALLYASSSEEDGRATVVGGEEHRICCHHQSPALACLSPAVGEPLLMRVATELGPYEHPTSLKKGVSPSAMVLQGKTWDPDCFSIPREPLPDLFENRAAAAQASQFQSLLQVFTTLYPCSPSLPGHPAVPPTAVKFLLPLACCPG